MERRLVSIEEKLKEIAQTLRGAVPASQTGNESYGEVNRRRLKERLMGAIRHRELGFDIQAASSWKERVFGICAPDSRLGKEGSRCSVPFVEASI